MWDNIRDITNRMRTKKIKNGEEISFAGDLVSLV